MKTIYFDMDGVLCDFESRCDELECWKPDVHKCNWNKMKEIGPSFWSEMKPIQKGLMLLKKVKEYADKNPGIEIGIFSAVHLWEGKNGKKAWLKKYVPFIPKELIKIINNGNFKHQEATPDSILIDDKEKNVENYRNAGGHSVLFSQDKSIDEMFDEIVSNLQ